VGILGFGFFVVKLFSEEPNKEVNSRPEFVTEQDAPLEQPQFQPEPYIEPQSQKIVNAASVPISLETPQSSSEVAVSNSAPSSDETEGESVDSLRKSASLSDNSGGENSENTANHLHQYAILGSFYAKNVRGIANPRVGLLNNGTEKTKGDSLRKEAFELLSKEASINFIGNVEAREIMSGAADVVVADGFTGNAVLKAIEGTGLGTMKTLKSAIMNGGLKAKLGAFLLKDRLKGMKETMDYSSAGGAVLFGLKAPVVKCHGSSDAKAVYYTIKQVRTMLDTKVVEQLVDAFDPKEETN